MAQSETERARLLEKANSLPLTPGVYLMRDRTGKVIYVGKSRKLKQRVSQYFQNSAKNIKTERMTSMVSDFDYFLCDNEMEALSLENVLIKQYSPKYNIRLKDAKSYPYIKLTSEEYPRLRFTRSRERDKAKYFGPYSGSGVAYALIDLANRTFGLPTCKHRFPRDIGRVRPCIYLQMKRCCGVCTGAVDNEAYHRLISSASDLLNGKTAEVTRHLREEMLRFAEEERFEDAARCRDTLHALSAIKEKQKVVASPDVEQDVVAFYSNDLCSAVSVFYIRSGILQDKADFLFGADSILDVESMSAFLCEHYRARSYIPPRVILSFAPEEEDLKLLSEYLTREAGHRVTVSVPERGALRTLCTMVERNAEEKAAQYQLGIEKEEGTLASLASLLQLESYPSRIEAYDISNLGSEFLTAGMIVCKEGKLCRADYRSFKIRTVEGTDDYASMREAIDRRLSHLTDAEGSFSELPDLILLDGGKGHVSVIRDLLRERGIEIPVFGMVKDDFHKTRALCTDSEEISIARQQEIFQLIYRIQEEVHRYTVGRMETAKRKTLKTSVLTALPGIGEVKARALLEAFDGTIGLKEAEEAQIAAVKGISQRNAATVYAHFHKETAKDGKEEEV